MQVSNVLHSARRKYRTQKFAICAPPPSHNFVGLYLRMYRQLEKQEGQHPLTGQRAANFRLLANQ